MIGGPPSGETEEAFEDYIETIPGTAIQFRMIAVAENGKSFWIGRTEVTWDEYELFYFGGADETSTPELERRVDAISRPTPPYGAPDQGWGTGKRPALSMTLHAAREYCSWLSALTGKEYRLPSSEEWVSTCLSGTGEPGEIDAFAWHRGNSHGMTHEVADLRPDGHGATDFLGNVAEFVEGGTDLNTPGEVAIRGGSYLSEPGQLSCVQEQSLSEAECLKTDPQNPKSKWWYSDCFFVGFRVARSAP